jgi:carbon monoxide dehydrogenase subunit G
MKKMKLKIRIIITWAYRIKIKSYIKRLASKKIQKQNKKLINRIIQKIKNQI